MTSNKDSEKYLLKSGKRHGKRVLACAETMARMGQNPYENLVRLAIKAEKEKDYSTASANWRYIGDFLDAKRKPVDPAELKDLQDRAVTLEELQKMKMAIIAGTHAAIEDHTVIENNLDIIEVNQEDSASDLV